MDAALKQRLVGASVIIALAVIFIPMIFDDSNRLQNQSISIKIPDEPVELKHKTLTIDSDSQAQNHQANIDSAINTKEVEAKNPIKIKETIIDVVDNSKTISSQNNSDEPKEIKKDKNPDIKIDTKAPKKEQKQEVSNNSNQIIDPTEPSYRLKLGSFSSVKNAQQLKAKIMNKGFQATVEKNPVSGLYQVFSNQLNSKKQAENLNLKLQNLNLNIGKTQVVKLDEEAQNEAELQLDTGWILQIGSFSSKENSLKLRDKIRKNGFVSFVDETFNSKKQQRFRVRIGPFATREEALLEQKKIKANMNLKSLIKPHEKQRVIN